MKHQKKAIWQPLISLHLQGDIYFSQFSPGIMISHKSVKCRKDNLSRIFLQTYYENFFHRTYSENFERERGEGKQGGREGGLSDLSHISRYLLRHSMAPDIFPCAFAIAALLLCIACIKNNNKKIKIKQVKTSIVKHVFFITIVVHSFVFFQ